MNSRWHIVKAAVIIVSACLVLNVIATVFQLANLI